MRLKGDSKEHSEATTNASLRDELLELLITGHETTASSICWAIKYLTDNPATQDRLRGSLLSAFPRGESLAVPSMDDLFSASLPYLDAVIAETLRLSNTGPVSFRQTLVECEILGHHVPAKTPIILVTAGPSYASPNVQILTPTKNSQAIPKKNLLEPFVPITMPPQLYPRDSFAPERWLHGGKFDPNAVRMLPFSAGSRGCFGKRIAMLELRIMIVILVLRFEFPRLGSALSGYQVRDGLTSRPAYCYVSPCVRKAFVSSSITH
jgi:cytochrome P450